MWGAVSRLTCKYHVRNLPTQPGIRPLCWPVYFTRTLIRYNSYIHYTLYYTYYTLYRDVRSRFSAADSSFCPCSCFNYFCCWQCCDLIFKWFTFLHCMILMSREISWSHMLISAHGTLWQRIRMDFRVPLIAISFRFSQAGLRLLILLQLWEFCSAILLKVIWIFWFCNVFMTLNWFLVQLKT